MYSNLLFEKDEGIGVITINRPKVLNALNRATLEELRMVVKEIAEDEETKVIILTGAGEKAFVAGADISEMHNKSVLEAREFGKLGQEVFMQIEKLEKPVIAAINGFALGGGCELAMACDLRIASDKAKFGQPEINLGVIPGFGGTQRLSRLVGKANAKELIFTGEMIDAQEAYRIGLVNKVVAADQLMKEVKAMARKLLSKPLVALKLAKAAIDTGVGLDLDSGMQYEAELFALCFATQDQKEGMGAFLEKRRPEFKGK